MGSKADLYRHRQVSSDFARLSLHNWFPPPRPPPPPPPPPPPSSTLSYIRPRFTSFPGLRSSSPTSSNQTPPDTPAYLDLPSSHSSALSRSKTTAAVPTTRPRANTLTRANTTATASSKPQQSRFGSHFGFAAGGWNDPGESSSNSIEEDDEEDADNDEQEWGLSKGMELFEVSAKDDLG